MITNPTSPTNPLVLVGLNIRACRPAMVTTEPMSADVTRCSLTSRRQRMIPIAMCRAVLVFVIVLAGLRSASAENLPKPLNAEARQHVSAGNDAFALKEFDVAIREYRAAAALETGSPAIITLWWNLGQAYRLKGNYDDAIWFYRQFLKSAPLKLPMFRHQAETFISEMEAERERAAMKIEPTGPAPSQDVPEPAAEASPKVDLPPPAWYADRVGWGLAGGGVIAIGIGGALLSSSASLHEQANEAQRPQSERMDLRDRASTRKTLAIAFGGAGAALAIAAVVKLSLTGTQKRLDEGVQVNLAPSGIYVSGRF